MSKENKKKFPPKTFTLDEVMEILNNTMKGVYPGWYPDECQRRENKFIDEVLKSKLP